MIKTARAGVRNFWIENTPSSPDVVLVTPLDDIVCLYYVTITVMCRLSKATVRYGTVRYYTVRYDTIAYGTVRYGIVPNLII